MDKDGGVRYLCVSYSAGRTVWPWSLKARSGSRRLSRRCGSLANDADILKDCIPGCQNLTKKSDTELEATVVLKIGPIKATFVGEVALKNLKPPHSYTIAGEGKGGIAGFAKGRRGCRAQPRRGRHDSA